MEIANRLCTFAPAPVVIRTQGVPRIAPPDVAAPGYAIRRRIEALDGSLPTGPLRQGHIYRVVLEGTLPSATGNLLVTDLLPGGFEVESARKPEGTFAPDRVEPRDDRVLFFRSERLTGPFRIAYLVRAVTVGRFALPPVELEALYDPAGHARAGGGGVVEVAR